MVKNYSKNVSILFFLLLFLMSCERIEMYDVNSTLENRRVEDLLKNAEGLFNKEGFVDELYQNDTDSFEIYWKPNWKTINIKSIDSNTYRYIELFPKNTKRTKINSNHKKYIIRTITPSTIEWSIATYIAKPDSNNLFNNTIESFNSFTGILQLKNLENQESKIYEYSNGKSLKIINSSPISTYGWDCIPINICQWATVECDEVYIYLQITEYDCSKPPKPTCSGTPNSDWSLVNVRTDLRCSWTGEPPLPTNPNPDPDPDGNNDGENNNGNPPQGPNNIKIDPNLTNDVKQKILDILDQTEDLNCPYGRLIKTMKYGPFSDVTFEQGDNSMMIYDATKKSILFENETYLNYTEVIAHELFHAFQHQYIYHESMLNHSKGLPGNINIEFERIVFEDLAQASDGQMAHVGASITGDAEFKQVYRTWIDSLTNSHREMPNLKTSQDFESQFMAHLANFKLYGNPFYTSTIVDPTLKPTALKEFFNGNNDCD